MRKSFSLNLAVGALGLLAVSSFAEVKVNDQLSLSGFLDMSTAAGFPDAGPKTYTASLDQFELDFLFKFNDKLTTRMDLNGSQGAMTVEQGFLSYATTPELTIQAGKFLSTSGWEAAEPTGMYQYTYSDALVYGGYQNGVNVSFVVSPMISLYAAYVASIWTNTDVDMIHPGFEAQVALMPTKEITVKVTGMYESINVAGDPAYGKSVINAWAAYIAGPLTAAVEGDYLMNYRVEDDNGFGYLIMANYKLTDVIAVTGRFSGISLSGNDLPPASPFFVGESNESEVTVSPSLTLLPNWLILAEAKMQLGDTKGLGLGLETTVTF